MANRSYQNALFYEDFDNAEKAEEWIYKNVSIDVHASDQGEGATPIECRFFTSDKLSEFDMKWIIQETSPDVYSFNAEDL
jgi:hypothetical protein